MIGNGHQERGEDEKEENGDDLYTRDERATGRSYTGILEAWLRGMQSGQCGTTCYMLIGLSTKA
jgi:hypothetical protein